MKKDKNDGKKITDKQNLQVKLLSEKMKERDKKIRIVKIAILENKDCKNCNFNYGSFSNNYIFYFKSLSRNW